MRLWRLASVLCATGGVLAAQFAGFDRNIYPGDAMLPALRRTFRFAGFWLNAPPGRPDNTWSGTRPALLRSGFGFLVLFNGRLEKELTARRPRNWRGKKAFRRAPSFFWIRKRAAAL